MQSVDHSGLLKDISEGCWGRVLDMEEEEENEEDSDLRSEGMVRVMRVM